MGEWGWEWGEEGRGKVEDIIKESLVGYGVYRYERCEAGVGYGRVMGDEGFGGLTKRTVGWGEGVVVKRWE